MDDIILRVQTGIRKLDALEMSQEIIQRFTELKVTENECFLSWFSSNNWHISITKDTKRVKMTNSGNCFMKFYTVPIYLSGKEMTSKRENEWLFTTDNKRSCRALAQWSLWRKKRWEIIGTTKVVFFSNPKLPHSLIFYRTRDNIYIYIS